jgi:hypothetical protein
MKNRNWSDALKIWRVRYGHQGGEKKKMEKKNMLALD